MHRISTTLRCTLTLLLLVAPLLRAQDISGITFEQGPNLPIAEVEMSIRKTNREVGMALFADPLATQKTDAAGKFQFKALKPGEYVISAAKQGYGGTDTPWFASDPPIVTVVLTDAPAGIDVRFPLIRRGTVTGVVIDPDSSDPIGGLEVSVVPVGYTAGKRAWLYIGGRTATTDAKGKFSFGELLLGDYAVLTNPRAMQKVALVKSPERDSKGPEFTYPTQFLPGSGAIDDVVPISIVSGISLDVGTLRLRKVPALAIKAVANCEGDKVEIGVSVDVGHQLTNISKGQVDCNQAFWLTGLAPNTYQLVAFTRPAETSVQAIKEFRLTDKDQDLSLPLDHGVAMEGRILLSDPSQSASLSGISVILQRRDGPLIADAESAYASTEKGTFHRSNIPPGRYEVVTTNRLPSGFYVRAVRSNNLPVPSRIFQWTGTGSLDIEIDDRPASLRGKVTEDRNEQTKNQTVQAQVLLGEAPFGADNSPSRIRRVMTDAQGSFELKDVSPGEYRIFAVGLENRQRVEEAGVFQRMWGSAEKIEIGRGETRQLDLKQRDPGR